MKKIVIDLSHTTTSKVYLPHFKKLTVHNGQCRVEVNEAKATSVLGIEIDCHLTWNFHIHIPNNSLYKT